MNNETYIFDNGKVYTMVDGKVVSSVKESEFQTTGSSHQASDDVNKLDVAIGNLVKEYKFNYDQDNEGQYIVYTGLGMNDPKIQEIESKYGFDCQPDNEGQCVIYTGLWQDEDGNLSTSNPEDEEARKYLNENPKEETETQMPAPPKDIQDDLRQQGGIQSRVTTPNGLSGKVLGRVSGMWGDEVTVRFDNGRIVRVPVSQGLTFHAAEKVVEENPIKALEARLAQSIDGSKESLENRVSELKSIRLEAAALIQKGAAYETEQELDRLRVEADYELGEVHAALEHLNDAETESFTAPAPFRMQAVEQESVGNSDSTWLDSTVNDMISEAEATDFGKLMDEGPEAFTAGLDAPALAEAGITRSIASRFINSKTAAANPELRERYEQVWLARVEECRKAELLNRKETTKKEAASQEEDQSNLPDDVLFT